MKFKYIVLDFETTALLYDNPEVLQVSAIDNEGNVLLSGYCRPEHTERWDNAQAVHGISPEMVADKPKFREGYLPKLIELLKNSVAVIAYNAAFERAILEKYFVVFDTPFIDPMIMFAEVYGDWSDWFQSYRWQKLTVAAGYYGFDFDAHDSLEDVRVTRLVYEQMLKDGVEPYFLN